MFDVDVDDVAVRCWCCDGLERFVEGGWRVEMEMMVWCRP
jgi:hypothetical protein